MQLIQGGTNVTVGCDRDTDWVTESETTIHKFLGTSDTTLQTDGDKEIVRMLSGSATTKVAYQALETIRRSKAVATFNGDQAGDTATVFVKEIKWERTFDIRCWQRRRFTITLIKR